MNYIKENIAGLMLLLSGVLVLLLGIGSGFYDRVFNFDGISFMFDISFWLGMAGWFSTPLLICAIAAMIAGALLILNVIKNTNLAKILLTIALALFALTIIFLICGGVPTTWDLWVNFAIHLVLALVAWLGTDKLFKNN